MNVIAKKYQLVARLGNGQFGSVCKARSLKTGKPHAVKLESSEAPYPLLKHEATLLYYLNAQKCTHIPAIHYFGRTSPYTCLVMSYYEQSLEDQQKTMDMDDKIHWWNTMLSVLSKIHKAGIVHRDIKPAHFMYDAHGEWHLIDFGLSTSYTVDSQHISQTPKDSIVGSPAYVSLYVHEGNEPVRRDDFLSLIYVFWELLYGTLWEPYTDPLRSDLDPTDIAHPFNIWLQRQKQWDRLYLLLEGKKEILRDGMYALLIHASHLGFSDKPQYDQFLIEMET